MTRLVLGPFNRVEGDLEVRLDVASGEVRAAHVVAPLYRGFEAMLVGRSAADALVYAPRICGICSVSQSVAAAAALAEATGAGAPPNGRHAINLVHAVENVADHLTHFYLFFMPDFARPAYATAPWYPAAAARFAAIHGEASAAFLPARAQWMQMMGVLAGKWPHTLSIQPGGTTRGLDRGALARLAGLLAGFRRFVERTVFGDRLENIAHLASSDALAAWAEAHAGSDFGRFLAIARSTRLDRLGPSIGRWMSFGGYPTADGHAFARGLVEEGWRRPLPVEAIAEDVSHAWYGLQDGGPPTTGRTHPQLDNADAYSWCKAPRLDGRPVEVGALARQLVDGQTLIVDLVARYGGNAATRVIARLVETARILLLMETWLAEIRPDETFIRHGVDPRAAGTASRIGDASGSSGAGLSEAARGSLGHWLRLRDGRIAHYQIIAPTTWNFSPRDATGTPGPLEQALCGTPVRPGETDPVSVQHVVRSFDPCMVCTVH
ncbi:MAG: nickel-dependent hydrogenase large subunit [Rhodospirillales bacterium]|nr:nickel-dependent hydrogenase large subunit [Rhodospirillales bacterium]